jgi:drug/metabolite transporter (DMT)-like permease
VVLSNVFFFMALAAMPLAEAVAIFFICPLLISLSSMVFLGETVGPRRWGAILLGLVGVAIVLRPGTEAFQMASLLPLVAAVCYTAHTHADAQDRGDGGGRVADLLHPVVVRRVERGGGACGGHGGWAGTGDPSLEFLLRAWVLPGWRDLGLMAFIGCASAAGGYAIGQAYRLSEAALIAPIEYAAIPMSVFWGLGDLRRTARRVAFGGSR